MGDIGNGFYSTDCCVCGILFAAPTDWVRARKADHNDFTCPNGHHQHFVGESDADLAERLGRENRELRDKLAAYTKLDEAAARAAAGRGPARRLARRLLGKP